MRLRATSPTPARRAQACTQARACCHAAVPTRARNRAFGGGFAQVSADDAARCQRGDAARVPSGAAVHVSRGPSAFEATRGGAARAAQQGRQAATCGSAARHGAARSGGWDLRLARHGTAPRCAAWRNIMQQRNISRCHKHRLLPKHATERARPHSPTGALAHRPPARAPTRAPRHPHTHSTTHTHPHPHAYELHPHVHPRPCTKRSLSHNHSHCTHAPACAHPTHT